MSDQSTKKYRWGLWGSVGVLSVIAIGLVSASPTTPVPTDSIQESVIHAPVLHQTRPTVKIESAASLSNSNTYTNVSGNVVHSPAYTSDGSVPAGATAQCGDGTYSFSQHHSGTCSHHEGVRSWL